MLGIESKMGDWDFKYAYKHDISLNIGHVAHIFKDNKSIVVAMVGRNCFVIVGDWR
jgi:hypothetical protein